MLNPQLAQIAKDTPVCQFPRESYNRMAEILTHLKTGPGIVIERVRDHWTIRVDQAWLAQFIKANVSQQIDAVENSASLNGGGGGGIVGAVTNVAWDESSHKLTQTKETANGPETTDIVTFVQEMP